MNLVVLSGKLGQDPELKHTNNGQAILKLRLATNERYKSKEGSWQNATEWHTVVMWGKRGEAVSEYLHTGKQVTVQGKLRTRSWETQEGSKRYATEIVADTIEFAPSQKRGDYEENQDREDSGWGQADDLPF